jgi:hypothetical protein
MRAEDLFEVIERQAEEGADFMDEFIDAHFYPIRIGNFFHRS